DGVVAEPAGAAIQPDHAVGGAVGTAGLDCDAIVGDGVAVAGVHALLPPVETVQPFLGRNPHHLHDLRADVDRIAAAGGVHVGDGGQVFDQRPQPALGLVVLRMQHRVVDGGRDHVAQRAEELDVLVPLAIPDVGDLHQPDRLAA